MSSPSPAGTGPTELVVVVDDGTTTSTWRLTCDPAGGTHPRADAACRALAENGAKALPPPPKDQACTQIYGGPQTARVTGTWRGQPVDASFSRQNGCEIGRWKLLDGLLPSAGS